MAVDDVHGAVAGRSHRHLEGTVGWDRGDDPGQVAVLLGVVAVGRVDHVANLKSGLLGRRARVNLDDLHALARDASANGLLVDSKIPPLYGRRRRQPAAKPAVRNSG